MEGGGMENQQKSLFSSFRLFEQNCMCVCSNQGCLEYSKALDQVQLRLVT